MEKAPDTVTGQPCPMCNKKTLTLMEEEREIPYFGKAYLFSMSCTTCKFHKADVETEQKQDPSKYTIDIESEKDMQIRIIKSSNATVKIPHMISMEPGEGSNGFISNIEGVLNRFKSIIETMRDSEEDPSLKKKAKNMLKKLSKVMWGQEKLKLIIEDPSGNSTIISDKAKKSKL
jgi:zinc finger protein|tara:strand:+ start:1887 stop:2411 length:525 start_codon:yes stop_codon:yes gene_type:complete